MRLPTVALSAAGIGEPLWKLEVFMGICNLKLSIHGKFYVIW